MELFLISLNYLWLALLPLKVAIGSILVGGFLVAEIVTATHQSEEMFSEISFNFVEDQFATTRDVHMSSTFLNWLWGGMQQVRIFIQKGFSINLKFKGRLDWS